MKFGCQQILVASCEWKSWRTARIIRFNKSSKRNCTISTGTS